jgi:CRISPR-associated protein Csy2
VEQSKIDDPNSDLFDLWTDFFAYKAESKIDEDQSTVQWVRKDKPNPRGWFVPLMIGFKGISPLYEGQEVEHHRDPRYPFRFVESLCQQKQNFQANIEPIEQPQPALDDGSFNFDFN